MAIWPWAEANQGLLSVLALGAALALALFEYFRAERAEGKRQRDYVRLVTDLLGGLVERLEELAMRRPTSEMLFSDTVGDWNPHIGKAYQVVESIIPTVPPNAPLALLMLEIREFLRMNDVGVGTQSAALEVQIGARRRELARLRSALTSIKG